MKMDTPRNSPRYSTAKHATDAAAKLRSLWGEGSRGAVGALPTRLCTHTCRAWAKCFHRVLRHGNGRDGLCCMHGIFVARCADLCRVS